jgi:hypothetical protein
MRIVFSKKNIKNRVQRDFFEKKKINQRENFIRYLKSVGIYFPGNGVISLSYSLTDDHVAYVIKKLNIGLKKFF